MNEEEEAHWFSGASQEPMGMKGMEGGKDTQKKKKQKKDSPLDYYSVCYIKVGYCKFMGGGVVYFLKV